MTERDRDREDDAELPPGAAQESGPLRSGKPIEPTPPGDTEHPTPEAERQSERIRRGGEPETSDDR